MLSTIHQWIDNSSVDNWQAYFGIFSVCSATAIHFQIKWIISFFASLDTTVVVAGLTLGQLLVGVFQGIVVGLIADRLYDSGDRYAKAITNSFDTKEKAFQARVVLMGAVGVFVGVVIPEFVNQYFEYRAIQLSGAIVCFGYVLLHIEVSEWNLSKEVVVVLSGFVLAFGPLLLEWLI